MLTFDGFKLALFFVTKVPALLQILSLRVDVAGTHKIFFANLANSGRGLKIKSNYFVFKFSKPVVRNKTVANEYEYRFGTLINTFSIIRLQEGCSEGLPEFHDPGYEESRS